MCGMCGIRGIYHHRGGEHVNRCTLAAMIAFGVPLEMARRVA
jgi:hypothetical protein